MPRALSEDVYEGMFERIIDCDQVDVVSDAAVPIDLTGSLASMDISILDLFEIIAGTPDGWRLEFAGVAGLPIGVTDTARHIVFSADDGVGGRDLRLVTPCTERVITAGDFANIGTFYLQVDQPVEP